MAGGNDQPIVQATPVPRPQGHAAAQSAPQINVDPPPDGDRGRAGNRKIQSPSRFPPSQASKTPPPNAGRKKNGDLSPGMGPAKPRPRANSTGSGPNNSGSKGSMLERIADGVKYIASPFVDMEREKMKKGMANYYASQAGSNESKGAGVEAGAGAGKRGGAYAGGGNRGKSGRGRGGQQGGSGQGRRCKSQENLTVPRQKNNGPKKEGGRASSVPRIRNAQKPPLFDVQNGGGGPHKFMLAGRWWKNLRQYTEPLIKNYAGSEYEKVRIAVLDTGVEKSARSNTPEFISQHGRQIKGGRSFIGENGENVPWWKDTNGHGTHITGLLLRVAPRAEVFIARVLDGSEKTIDPKNVEEALKWCIDEWKVDIITMSFGFDRYHAGIEAQLNRAWTENILIFAAASNDGISKSVNVAWPARERTVFCIFSATGEGENSSFNPPPTQGLNFATLGEAVESDWPLPLLSDQEREQGLSTLRTSGTSFATPIAAAIAALVLEFARQPPLSDIPEVARQLKRLDRMEEVFEMMSERNVDGYHFVYPWLLFNAKEMGRGTSEGDAYDRHSARGWAEGVLTRLVGRHVQIF